MIQKASKIKKSKKKEKLKSKEFVKNKENGKDKDKEKSKEKSKEKDRNKSKSKETNPFKNKNKKLMKNILVVEIINKGEETEAIATRKRKIKIDKGQETKNIKDKNKTGISKEMINTMMTDTIRNKKRNTRKTVRNLVLKIDTLKGKGKGKGREEIIDVLMLFNIKSVKLMMVDIAILCKIIKGHEEKSVILNSKRKI